MSDLADPMSERNYSELDEIDRLRLDAGQVEFERQLAELQARCHGGGACIDGTCAACTGSRMARHFGAVAPMRWYPAKARRLGEKHAGERTLDTWVNEHRQQVAAIAAAIAASSGDRSCNLLDEDENGYELLKVNGAIVNALWTVGRLLSDDLTVRQRAAIDDVFRLFAVAPELVRRQDGEDLDADPFGAPWGNHTTSARYWTSPERIHKLDVLLRQIIRKLAFVVRLVAGDEELRGAVRELRRSRRLLRTSTRAYVAPEPTQPPGRTVAASPAPAHAPPPALVLPAAA